jgi:nucleoid-associated protein YgaU
LAQAQAPWATTKSEFAAHAADPDAHHAKQHVLANASGLGTDHTISGAVAGWVLRATASNAARMAQLMVTDLDYDEVVTSTLNVLRNLAKKKTPILIGWSSWEVGHWRITGLSTQSLLRHKNSNEITRATVDLEFTLASDAKAKLGPVSGGKGGDSDQDSDEDTSKMPTWYTVKKGDTVITIAMKFYHKYEMWRFIAALNDIDDPHKELKVGRKIRLHK